MDRELLDAGEIAGHLVPAGSVFAFLAEHRRQLFPDSFTADLFPSRTGRPSLPADLAGPCWCSRSWMTCLMRRPRRRWRLTSGGRWRAADR